MMLKRISRNKFYSSLDQYNDSRKKDKQFLLQIGSNRGFSSLDDSTIDDYTTLSYSSSIKGFKRSRLHMLYNFLRYKHAVIVIRGFLKKVIISRRSRNNTSKIKKFRSIKPLGGKFNHTKLEEDDDKFFPQSDENDDYFRNNDLSAPHSQFSLLLSSESSRYLEAMQLEVQNDEYGGVVCHSKMVKFKFGENNPDNNNFSHSYYPPKNKWNNEMGSFLPKSVTNNNNQIERFNSTDGNLDHQTYDNFGGENSFVQI